MEFIHKAKAEKNRTKVLSDQMEARRTKNKVGLYFPFADATFLSPLCRRLASVARRVLRRSGRRSSRWSTRPQRRTSEALVALIPLSSHLHRVPYAMRMQQYVTLSSQFSSSVYARAFTLSMTDVGSA
jgi:hypothetical protein